MVESIWVAENWVKKLLVEKHVKELSMDRDLPMTSPNMWIKDMNLMRAKIVSDLNVPFEILAGFEVVEFNNYRLCTTLPNNSSIGGYPQKLKTIKLTSVFVHPKVGTFMSKCSSLENISLIACNYEGANEDDKLKIHNSSVKVLNLELVNVNHIEVFVVNLEGLVLDAVSCDPKLVVIVAPNLKELHCYNTYNKWASEVILRGIRHIIEGLFRVVTLEGINYPIVFENLESLHIQINLRNERDSMLLAKVLKSCNSLVNLEIINDDEATEEFDNERQDHETNDSNLSYATNICITEKLEEVCIRGFKGIELELEFVKYLITMFKKMEEITIWFDDDCKWECANATMRLLSFPKNSTDLSIILKPGKQYMESVGGSSKKWVSTLNH